MSARTGACLQADGRIFASRYRYTRVKKNVAPDQSQGWTIVLMDRATRFLWEMHCGRKERKLFKHAMQLLCDVIQQTSDLTLLTDGERRYGSLLFEIELIVRFCRKYAKIKE